MDAHDTRHLLAVATEAARRAGEVLRQRAGRARLIRHKSSDTDPVTDADLASEAAISALLAEVRPDDGLITEEGAAHAGHTGLRWVVDPLDGTVNARYGLPHFAVSIACEQAVSTACEQAVDGEPDGWRAVVAAVHDPIQDEIFTAVRNRGARLNGQRIMVNDPVPLRHALLATGFAYGSRARSRQAEAIGPLISQARDIRSLGSAALALCWLAAGRFDAFCEDELARWDWAAGALIAREAGATVTPLGSGVLAAGPALHPALANAVAAPHQHRIGKAGMIR